MLEYHSYWNLSADSADWFVSAGLGAFRGPSDSMESQFWHAFIFSLFKRVLFRVETMRQSTEKTQQLWKSMFSCECINILHCVLWPSALQDSSQTIKQLCKCWLFMRSLSDLPAEPERLQMIHHPQKHPISQHRGLPSTFSFMVLKWSQIFTKHVNLS